MRKQTSTAKLAILAGLFVHFGFMSAAFATEPGAYIAGSIGQSKFDSTGELENICAEYSIDCRSDDTDTGFRIMAGYQFNNWLALEGGYTDLGSLSAAPVLAPAVEAEFSMSGFNFAILPQIPLGSVAFLYGRFGVLLGEAELTARAPFLGLSESEKESGGSLSYGLGAGFNLGERITLRFEWERYSLDEVFDIADKDIDSPDIDLLSGTLVVRFPR